jgi:hypothetical protein
MRLFRLTERLRTFCKIMTTPKKYDVFICHASEDKESFVDPLARALKDAGLTVWYDQFVLEWGDTLRGAIDRGLVDSRYGIVVFSPGFLKRKKWTEHELDGLFAREQSGNKVILPIWHNVKREDLLQYGPSLADRLAKDSVADSIEDIVLELKRLLASTSSRAGAAKPAQKGWQDEVESYAASVVQVGGVGSRLTTKTAWLTAGEHAYLDADRFVFVGFNGGGDLMSLSVKEGYEVIGCSSPTGNQIIEEDCALWRRILLEDKLQNALIIHCKRVKLK